MRTRMDWDEIAVALVVDGATQAELSRVAALANQECDRCGEVLYFSDDDEWVCPDCGFVAE